MKFIDWFMGYALVWVLIGLCIAALCVLVYVLYLLFEEHGDGAD